MIKIMNRLREFSEEELSQDDKDKIGILVDQREIYPDTFNKQNFPNKADLLRVLKFALKGNLHPKVPTTICYANLYLCVFVS